jgi:hypothetical protein
MLQSRLDYGVRKVFHKHFFIDRKPIVGYIPPLSEEQAKTLSAFPFSLVDVMKKVGLVVSVSATDVLRLPQTQQGKLYQMGPHLFVRPVEGKTFVRLELSRP